MMVEPRSNPGMSTGGVAAGAAEVTDVNGKVISSRTLLRGASTLVIEHEGMYYTLRATRNGKLILTK